MSAAEDRIREIIAQAGKWRLPIDGARLHLGEDALAELKSRLPAAPAPPVFGQIGVFAYHGVPVVVEDGKPNLVELRWTICG